MDKTIIIAAEISATATTEMAEIILMKFFFRVEKRYLLAMNNGRFKNVS